VSVGGKEGRGSFAKPTTLDELRTDLDSSSSSSEGTSHSLLSFRSADRLFLLDTTFHEKREADVTDSPFSSFSPPRLLSLEWRAWIERFPLLEVSWPSSTLPTSSST